MAYQCGSYQTGLPSREAPYVAPLTGQSSWQTGLSHVGGFSIAVKTSVFRCVAKLQAPGKIRHRCTGLLAKSGRVFMTAAGYVYHSNFRAGYFVRARLSVAGAALYRAAAVMTQAAHHRHKITGVLSIGVAARHKVTAICQANFAAIYRVAGTMQQRLRKTIRITGLLHANYQARVKVRAVLWQFTSARYRITGLLGQGASALYKAVGSLRQTGLGFYRVDGDLANTIGHWFVKVTGKINVAAFVGSVPKRVQEFVTNKTWFK